MVENPAFNDTAMSRPPYRPLLRVRGSYPLHVAILGKVHTWLMHWDEVDRRTQPCLLGECNHCQAFISRRPLSYLAVSHLIHGETGVRWQPSVIEVPLITGIEISKLASGLVTLRRTRAKGPIEVGNFSCQTSLPSTQTFDIVPHLKRLWRVPPNRQLVLLDDTTWSMWSVADG